MKKSAAMRLATGAAPSTRGKLETLLDAKPARKKPGIRIPRPQKMSGPELEYLLILRERFPGLRIEFEGWTVRLKSGAKYTPDFTVWGGARLLYAVEVKGPHRLQSAARSHLAFITAAQEWPDIFWIYAKREENGEWVTTGEEF